MVDLAVAPAPNTDQTVPIENQVITVVSPKGGAGKTTLAVNLAVGLARFAPRDVVVVDTDLQFGDVGTAMGLRPRTTFYDAVRVGLDDPVALKLQLTPHESGCYALCAPEHPAHADAITPGHVRQVVHQLKQSFRYVIVDNEPGLGERALGALDEATDILMLCVTDVPSVRGLRKAADVLDQIHLTEPNRHFILNRADAMVELTEDDIVRSVGHSIDHRVPSSRVFPLAMNRGVPVVIGETQGEALEALWELISAIGGDEVESPFAKKKRGGLFRSRA